MKKVIILLILLAAVLSTEGCTEKTQANITNADAGLKKNTVIEVTSLEQINTSLQQGPVFLRVGSDRCSQCRKMKPILKGLAKEYGGNVTVMSVDADQSPEIAEYFDVKPIPDSSIIMCIENGTYVYMQRDRSVGTDRSEARIIGLKDKKVFEKLLDQALLQDGGSIPEGDSINSDVNVSLKNNTIIAVTSLEQINTALQEGPVFLRIGAEWCKACKGMKPILKELAAEYEGKVTVMSVDVDQSPDLVEYFDVKPIPDSSVIIGIEKGKYIYMRGDGNPSKDRSEASIVGLYDEEMYEELLDLALLQEGGNNPD
jgi:thiol-disulfide isomerase/thioredoxin